MLFLDENRNASAIDSEAGLKTPVHPGSAALRRALRANIVCFPTRIPILLKAPPADMQWRMVLLFFVRGWSSARIAARFQVPKHRILRSLNEWSVRALALGYVQIIDPEAFEACCQVDVEYGTEHDSPEARPAGFKPAFGGMPQLFADREMAPAAPVALTPDASPDEIGPAQSEAEGADLVGALDVAIARCEEWRGEFWMHLATVLRDMRAAAAAALEFRRPGVPADGLFAAFPSGGSSLPHGLHTGGEERVYHAVI
jgi:hypothetical protein